MSRDAERRVAELDTLPPLGDPPAHLTDAARAIWFEIRSAAPDVLRASDVVIMEMTSEGIATARGLVAAGLPRTAWIETVRMAYRVLGDLFIPMAARRALIFPRRH